MKTDIHIGQIFNNNSTEGVDLATVMALDANVLQQAKAYTDDTVGEIETILETI